MAQMIQSAKKIAAIAEVILRSAFPPRSSGLIDMKEAVRRIVMSPTDSANAGNQSEPI